MYRISSYMAYHIGLIHIHSYSFVSSKDICGTEAHREGIAGPLWRGPNFATWVAQKRWWRPNLAVHQEVPSTLRFDASKLVCRNLQADMGPMDQDIWDDEEEEMRRADEGYLGVQQLPRIRLWPG